MTRLARDWRALTSEQRLAAVAAVALFVTMLLPWYQQNAVINAPRQAPLESQNLDAFQVFSFIEAAVLLVALAVLFLLYSRAEGREFQLPGSDGAVVLGAGLWAALLLILRLFDKPGVTSHGIAANVGVQWGIFFALAAAGVLAYAGSRMRAAQLPETPRSRRRPPPDDGELGGAAGDEAETRVQRARPRYPQPPQGSRPRSTPRGALAAGKTSEQLSFEDAPPEPPDDRE